MSRSWDYIAKIVSLGDSGCGKSSLTIRLCEGRFVDQHDVTIGVEFGSRIVPVGPPATLRSGINDPIRTKTTSTAALLNVSPDMSLAQRYMKLSLWDTAGQETYKSITRSYFRGASGALLVFDITRRATFNSVTSWLHDLRQIAEKGIIIVLVGNKADLSPSTSGVSSGRQDITNRQVTELEAEDWCKRNGVVQYVETSAKSGDGVERAFLEVAERIFQNIEAGKYDLKDRRSGVKSAGFDSTSRGVAKTVNLRLVDVSLHQSTAAGACC